MTLFHKAYHNLVYKYHKKGWLLLFKWNYVACIPSLGNKLVIKVNFKIS